MKNRKKEAASRPMRKNVTSNNLKLKYKGVKGYIRYFGRKNINLSFSSNLKKWRVLKRAVLEPRPGYFDTFSLSALNPLLIKEGILLLYFVKDPLSLGAALFSKKNPQELLWRSANPIWETKEKILPRSVKKLKESLTIYFETKENVVKKIVFPLRKIFGREYLSPILERAEENPVIEPTAKHPWESQYTFNTAAVYENKKVHLVYRAIGNKGISVLGYAASQDGIHVDERLDKPCYVPQEPFESPGEKPLVIPYNFMSGGGFGGCEDPRITKLDDKFYMTYVAFNGIPRVALTSIKVDDFLQKRWNWKKPVLISPPDQVHKNWVIFPEKIKEKYAILHSVSPNILVDYFDSLDFDGKTYIKSYYSSEGRKGYWDSKVRGVGPPPIKTKDGWLILYHALDDRDPGRYKMGAMILDYNDLTKVLYRSAEPILEPEARYENEGFKAGVVYSCGAVVINDRLFVYYGGADTVICVATTNLNEFLKGLKNSQPIKLQSAKITKFSKYVAT